MFRFADARILVGSGGVPFLIVATGESTETSSYVERCLSNLKSLPVVLSASAVGWQEAS